MGWYLTIRVLLWLIGVGVSLFPTMEITGLEILAWPPSEILNAINSTGKVRDILFVLVTTAVLEISLSLDSIYVNKNEMGKGLFSACIILLILNILVLGSSLSAFHELPADHAVSPASLNLVVWVLGTGAIIGLLTEVIVSIGNEHLRRSIDLPAGFRSSMTSLI